MPSTKTKVLVIEDSESIALLQQAILEGRGYAVELAETGARGLELIYSWLPDILILDITLPDTDGITILKTIKNMAENDLPDVIVLSGHDDPEITFESLRNGALDFIRKPFHNEEYLLRVHAAEQLRHFRKANQALQIQLEDDLRKLSRYFSKDLIHAILDGTISANPGGQITTATFMMFDLRGSTTLAEHMGPQKFFEFLSDFFADIADLIHHCNGAINKFTGDGFLVTFGLRDYSPQSTLDALSCAMKLRAHIELYNQVRPPEMTDVVGYGIGITTGEVFAGNIGNIHKMEYTILGDPVNTSARLEAMTKNAQVDILIDLNTRTIAGDKLKVKRLSTTAIRGKNEAVEIFYPIEFLA